MSRNGAGTYSLPAGNPVVDGTDITVAWGNDTMNDIATALTNSVAANGETPITANIPMAGFKLTGVGSATALTDATTATDVQKGTATYLTSVGGTANAITATGPYAMAAYTAGQQFRFKAASTSTANSATLNINSLGAKNILYKPNLALPVGAIVSGSIYSVTYDGSNFQIESPPLGMTEKGVGYENKGDSGTTTQDLIYTYGACKRIKATGDFTITTSAWPASGTLGEMLLLLVADGTGRTITYTLGSGTTNFIKTDGTFVATPALSGVTMQTANNAIDFIYMWSVDGGVTVYAKVLR